MQNLSNSSTRTEAIRKQSDYERREVKQLRSNYSIQGEAVEIIKTYSRSGKRIAFVQDEDGDKFEVFYEMLE